MDGDVLHLIDGGRPTSFTFDDVLAYHGPGSPGGAAVGFKALQRALPLLSDDGSPCERRAIHIDTPFGGPGARDAFELVTHAVTDGRFRLDPTLAQHDRGRLLERFVFRFSLAERSVTLVLRDGFITDEFLDLAQTIDRTADQERRLTTLKRELCDRVMAHSAAEVYDVSDSQSSSSSSTAS
jgi:hypothetical protein